MYIAVDALANVDDSKLSYMIFPFDEDLLEAIEDYFYFSGFGKQGTKKDSPAIKFVSENFNIVTIEKLRKYVKSKRDMVN